MKNFKIWAWTEKQKAQSAKYAFTELKTHSGLKKNGNAFSRGENVFTEIRFHLKHAGPGLVRDVRLTGGAGHLSTSSLGWVNAEWLTCGSHARGVIIFISLALARGPEGGRRRRRSSGRLGSTQATPRPPE